MKVLMIKDALFVLLLAFLGVSQAVEVKIVGSTTDSFEVRDIQIPGGKQTRLYVITGSPLRLEVDGDRITAEYVEFDEESQIMRIVGPGNVAYDDVSTKGEDYLLDLSSGELDFQNVFIFTAPLDIEGVAATRLPGQIDVSGAAFSPCSRCDQRVQDYRFQAERMNLYPGDRLVAFNVTVYLRDLPSFFLPLMVIPLGPEERRPRFALERGTEDERAEVALDWPYVVGSSAFGTASLRYFADVNPGGGSGPAETILGGQVEKSYFGGGFDHRFYTARGRGSAQFFYTPPFEEPLLDDDFGDDPGDPNNDPVETRRTRDEVTLSFGYETEADLGGLQTDVLLERNDDENQRIVNLSARLDDTYHGFEFGLLSQTYLDLDLDPDDDAYLPSYENSVGALRTYGRAQTSPEDDLTFSVGPFTVTNFLLEAGAYEDYANSSNNSAFSSPLYLKGTPIIRGGRLVERHTITLDTLSPLPGSSIRGSTDYTGQLYTTTNPGGENERLVDWTTVLNAEQTFRGGAFGVDFNHVILEGETPFQFDARTTPNNRTTLQAELSLTPAEWLELSAQESYVFVDDRDDNEVGAGPIETRAELFGNLSWLEAVLEQSYDVKENDPGLLGATLGVSTPSDSGTDLGIGLGDTLTGNVRATGVYDLDRTPTDRTDPAAVPVDESEVDVEASVTYDVYATLDASSGYDFNREPSAFGYDYGDGFDDNDPDGLLGSGDEGRGRPLYKPLELGFTLGTTTQDDTVPSLRVSVVRDLNDRTADTRAFRADESLGLELGARLGPLELDAEQNFDYGNADADPDDPIFYGDANDSRLTLTYPEVAELSATGFSLLPPRLFGVSSGPTDTTTYTLGLLDLVERSSGDPLYELSYETTYGPLLTLAGDEGIGFSETSVNAKVDLETSYLGTPLGPLGFGVAFTGVLAVADDALPLTYFSNGALSLTTDFFSRVGVQGGLEYLATYDESTGRLGQQSLGLREFGVTVRAWEGLYVSAVLNDRWDFNSGSAYTPFNFQPVIYVTLDRCCWALYGALDTSTGTVSLSLGYPGSADALTGAFNTILALPRRQEAP